MHLVGTDQSPQHVCNVLKICLHSCFDTKSSRRSLCHGLQYRLLHLYSGCSCNCGRKYSLPSLYRLYSEFFVMCHSPVGVPPAKTAFPGTAAFGTYPTYRFVQISYSVFSLRKQLANSNGHTDIIQEQNSLPLLIGLTKFKCQYFLLQFLPSSPYQGGRSRC